MTSARRRHQPTSVAAMRNHLVAAKVGSDVSDVLELKENGRLLLGMALQSLASRGMKFEIVKENEDDQNQNQSSKSSKSKFV